MLLISISLCQHLFSKTRTGTFPDMGAVFRLKRSGAQTAPDLFLLGFSYKENTRHKCGPEGSKREKPHGARLAHRRVGNREHFRCRRCKLTPQKVGSDSELSRGRLQPSRRAEYDLLRKRRGVATCVRSDFYKKIRASDTKLAPTWLGWLDSDQRDDGVKVRCLTTWRQPNIQMYPCQNRNPIFRQIRKKGKKPFSFIWGG